MEFKKRIVAEGGEMGLRRMRAWTRAINIYCMNKYGQSIGECCTHAGPQVNYPEPGKKPSAGSIAFAEGLKSTQAPYKIEGKQHE